MARQYFRLASRPAKFVDCRICQVWFIPLFYVISKVLHYERDFWPTCIALGAIYLILLVVWMAMFISAAKTRPNKPAAISVNDPHFAILMCSRMGDLFPCSSCLSFRRHFAAPLANIAVVIPPLLIPLRFPWLRSLRSRSTNRLRGSLFTYKGRIRSETSDQIQIPHFRGASHSGRFHARFGECEKKYRWRRQIERGNFLQLRA